MFCFLGSGSPFWIYPFSMVTPWMVQDFDVIMNTNDQPDRLSLCDQENNQIFILRPVFVYLFIFYFIRTSIIYNYLYRFSGVYIFLFDKNMAK